MRPLYRLCGIHSGPHKEYEYMCPIEYAGGFCATDAPDIMDERIQSFEEKPVDYSGMPEGEGIEVEDDCEGTDFQGQWELVSWKWKRIVRIPQTKEDGTQGKPKVVELRKLI